MKYLDENKVSYRDMDFQEVTDAWGKLFIIVEGDWKHDHLYIDYMVDEWFNQNGIQYINGGTQVLDDGESDYYAGKHEYRIILRSIDYDTIANAYEDSVEYKDSLKESLLQEIHDGHMYLLSQGFTDEQIDKFCELTKSTLSELLYSEDWFNAFENWTKTGELPKNLKLLGENTKITESVYTENGYKNRKDYLMSLADEYGVDVNTVLELASILGPDEDFDALVTEIEDLSDYADYDYSEPYDYDDSVKEGHFYVYKDIEKMKQLLFDFVRFDDELVEDILNGKCDYKCLAQKYLEYFWKDSLELADEQIVKDVTNAWENACKSYIEDKDEMIRLKNLTESKKISEDTVKKSNGKWTNRGDDGKEHGEFKTKKEADKQRKAMYANGYTGESRRNNMSITIKELKETSGINMKTSIKDWYMKEFPDDDLGERINSTVNFDDILNALQNHTDIYDVIDVGDSVVRERIFDKLSKLINKDYNYIYNLWLGESLHESSPITKDSSTPYFRAFVTNLGKYNEGELVGEWVDFPIDEDDFDEVLKRIQIGDTDDFGAPYEEWFVTDYDCDLDGFDWQELGEYPSYDSLQEYGEMVESIDDVEAVANAYEVTGDLREAIEGIDSGSIIYYPGCNTEEELGEYVINEIYGGEITPDLAERYFDYDKLGRDLGFDEYENPDYDPDDEDSEEYISAGEYWCGDEYASDSDIGAEYVAAVGFDGVSNIENYFDYEAFGRDLTFEGFTLTKDGAIEYT